MAQIDNWFENNKSLLEEPASIAPRAGSFPEDEKFPADEAIIAGQLANGLRYFIRDNDKPSVSCSSIPEHADGKC